MLSIFRTVSVRARGVATRATWCAAALVALGLGTSAAPAAVLFTGFGNNPETAESASGTAEFTIAGNDLIVVLTNTTNPRTTAQGNTLTGVTFDINPGAPTLSLTSIAMTSGAELWTSKTTSLSSATLAGSWTDVLGASPLGEYGAATTGFAGRFNGGSITLGNAGPNYGIVAAGTFDGTNVSFGGSQFPFVQASLTLTFSGAAGLSEAQIENVLLLFGTDGRGVVTTIPEPATALLTIGALLALRRR